MRSPVELAQAALTIQVLSSGRFELGIGAGWSATELTGAGLAFPDPAVRVRRLREAVCVVRDLLQGACRFTGEFYDIDLPAVGLPVSVPPPLSAALGGPASMRTIGPLVDRIELYTVGAAFGHGFAGTSRADVQRLIDVAREANAAASITLSLHVAPGIGPAVDHFQSLFEGSCFEGLAGPAERVADAIRTFSDLDIDRINVMPPIGGVADLAAHLLQPNH